MSGSLREFVDDLRRQGSLLVVSREVDPRFELNAVVRKVQATRNQAILFEKVRGTRYRVLSNAVGNYPSIARLVGTDVRGVAARFAELARATAPITAEHASAASQWEEISLTELPHVTYCEKDAGPYITAGVIVARDPDTRVVNLSYHRMQMVSGEELRCRLSTSGDLYRIQQKLEKRGEPLAAVVAIGLPPAVMLAGASTIGPDVSEYDLAARIAGARFALTTAPHVDLPVPDSTEILIEGEILPDVRRPEGPFGEWMDYYVPVTDNHVFLVKHVLARKDALFYATSAGSSEELALTAVPMAGGIYASVRTWVPSVRDVTCYPLLQFCFVQLGKHAPGHAQRAIVAAFGAEMNRLLYCVVVDDDVDIHDPRDVLWAMATRCRPDRMTFTIPGVPSFARDPHQVHWGRLGIDATLPAAHAPDFERKAVPGLAAIDLDDYLRPDR